MKKYSTAGFFLNKALAANQLTCSSENGDNNSNNSNTDTGGSNVNLFAMDKKSEILYNTGLQLYVCGNPELASACFHRASDFCYNKPTLWLRVAECCVVMHVERLRGKRDRNSSDLVRNKLKGTDLIMIQLTGTGLAMN